MFVVRWVKMLHKNSIKLSKIHIMRAGSQSNWRFIQNISTHLWLSWRVNMQPHKQHTCHIGTSRV